MPDADEVRQLRERIAALESRLAGLVRVRAEPRKALLGRVIDLGAKPSVVPGVFAVDVERPAWDEAAGASAPTGPADPPGRAFVLVLGPGVPGAGARVVARRVGDRWAARHGVAAPPRPCVHHVCAYVSTGTSILVPLPGASVSVRDAGGAEFGTCVTTTQSGGPFPDRLARCCVEVAGGVRRTYVVEACHHWSIPGDYGEPAEEFDCCGARTIDTPPFTGCDGEVRALINLCCGRQTWEVRDFDTGETIALDTIDYGNGVPAGPPERYYDIPGYYPTCAYAAISCFESTYGLGIAYSRADFIPLGYSSSAADCPNVRCGIQSVMIRKHLCARLTGPVPFLGALNGTVIPLDYADGVGWYFEMGGPGSYVDSYKAGSGFPGECERIFFDKIAVTLFRYNADGLGRGLGIKVANTLAGGTPAGAGPICWYPADCDPCDLILIQRWPTLPAPPCVQPGDSPLLQYVPSSFDSRTVSSFAWPSSFCSPVDLDFQVLLAEAQGATPYGPACPAAYLRVEIFEGGC